MPILHRLDGLFVGLHFLLLRDAPLVVVIIFVLLALGLLVYHIFLRLVGAIAGALNRLTHAGVEAWVRRPERVLCVW